MTTDAANADLIFGKYDIQSRLAIGGMGEVFFAVQRGVQGFERPAILKNLLPDLAQQEGFVEQFLDEARVAATLNHPNVVSIYEVGLWNGTYFIAMEYIQGRNVSQLIKVSLRNKTPMPPLVAAQIVRDAALGLHHAHVAKDARGQPLNIVHRDISPQNIMVRDDGVTKVVDFGIARASNRATRTATGTVKGKLAYMAPEQVTQSSAALTAHADQYSLGVVLWEMCAARRLFRADNDIALMGMVLQAKVPRLTEVAPAVPPALADVVARMVAAEPTDRFPSCAQVAKELDAVLGQFPALNEESPVATFLRELGPWDVPTPQVTPSSPRGNFVISLGGGAGRASPGSGLAENPTRAGGGPSVDVDLSPTGVLPPGAGATAGRGRRAAVVAGVAALLLAVAGVGWRLTSGRVPPPEPVPPSAPAVVVPPTPGPVPVVPAPAPPAANATWTLKTTPPGAVVRLDGRPLGNSPLDLVVSPGESHFLLVERPGFKRDERELPPLAPGEAKALQLTLSPLRQAGPPTPVNTPTAAPVAAAAVGPGFLTLSTTPWTKVTAGREVLGSTPLFKVRLPPGEHTLTLVNEGQNVNTTRQVTIKPGEVTKLDLKL